MKTISAVRDSIHIPTAEEYSAVRAERRGLWVELSEDWRCPVCGRTKFEILRYGVARSSDGKIHRRWKGSLHRHHDHGGEWNGIEVICGDCNMADGLAKRCLSLPKDWSFSVAELREFVTCIPHGAIERVDLDVAMDIFLESLKN